MKHFIGIALLAAAGMAHAQASAPAPVSAAKKELAQRMVTLQLPALDSLARNLAERPARQMMAGAEGALQNVPADKRQAVAEQIQGDVRKYLEEAVPLVRDRATKIAQSTLGPMFEEKFSEDEMRQLAATFDSPAYKKFQQTQPDFTNAFVQKLVADSEPSINPKVSALQQRVAAALGISPQASAASAPKAAKPAASAASKPAKK